MLHFLKYFILTVFLFALLNLFRSNLDAMVSLRFQIPLIFDWFSPPIALNYLLLVGFCVGILFAAFLGAFRYSALRNKNKEIKNLKKELVEQKGRSLSVSSPIEDPAKPANLPPLVEEE